MPTPSKQGLISDYGIEAICHDIGDGKGMNAIAASLGVSFGTLNVWLHADPERLARANKARLDAARMWDERAETVLEQAKDPFELTKAKELAHHYRWRAAKIDPKQYGDRVQTDVNGKVTLEGLVKAALAPPEPPTIDATPEPSDDA